MKRNRSSGIDRASWWMRFVGWYLAYDRAAAREPAR